MLIKDSLTTNVKIAEQIFKALNLEKVSRINLRKLTNKKIRKLKRQGKYQSDPYKPVINYNLTTEDNSLYYY